MFQFRYSNLLIIVRIGEECGSIVTVTKTSNMEKIKLKPTRCSNEDCTSNKFQALKESMNRNNQVIQIFMIKLI